jgi:phosphohistidine swiveling domain-containing protein
MNLSKNEFIKTYGFLRPGTFDSRTLKYEEDFERYFPNFGQTKNQQINDNFLIKDFVQKLDKFKELQAISNSTEQFIDFCIRSIVSRESVKFELSKNISYTLDLINELGIEKEVGKEQIAFSNIDFFLNSYTKTQFNLDELKTVCEIGIVNYQETQAVWLPPVIGESDDVYNFKLFETHPNYVTQEQVTGSIQELGKESLNLHSKIVLIESADPGFDWIFTHSISGLITSYGGQNSHMAIRCKELNIPAIIGVGEINFSLIKKSSVVYIDCLNKRFVCVG